MGSAEEKSTGGGGSDITPGGLILSTAAQTVKWLTIFIALGATLFCCLFPYNMMNIFRSLGNYPMALDYCDVCIKGSEKNGKEYGGLLADGINMSAFLLSEQTDEPYLVTYDEKSGGFNKNLVRIAERLNGYTAKYLDIPGDVRLSCSKAVDEYNIKNIAPSVHPNVYNFEAYVYGKFVYTSQVIGKNDSAVTAMNRLSSAVSESEKDISGAVIAISGLNAYYDFEFYRLGTGASSPVSGRAVREIVSGDLELLCGYIPELSEMIVLKFNLDKLLEMAYNTRMLAVLADNVHAAARAGNYPAAVIDECEAAKYVSVPGSDAKLSLWALYNESLKFYIQQISN